MKRRYQTTVLLSQPYVGLRLTQSSTTHLGGLPSEESNSVKHVVGRSSLSKQELLQHRNLLLLYSFKGLKFSAQKQKGNRANCEVYNTIFSPFLIWLCSCSCWFSLFFYKQLRNAFQILVDNPYITGYPENNSVIKWLFPNGFDSRTSSVACPASLVPQPKSLRSTEAGL